MHAKGKGSGTAKRTPRKATDLRVAVARSKVTNGVVILPGIDGRTPVARRYRDLCSAVVSDQGGTDRMSEARMQLVRRFAGLCVLSEDAEARMVNGESINIVELCQLTSTLTRVVQRLGINRVAKEITPLSEYLKSNVQAPRDAT
jgi:hypothetical protein